MSNVVLFLRRKMLLLGLVMFFLSGWSNDLKSSDGTKNILIYWDTSLSMESRNLDLEFQFLKSFFENHERVQLSLIAFSHKLETRKSYSIQAGSWDDLKADLQTLTYDGIALFDLLDLEESADQILIFSDGLGVLDELMLPLDKEVFLIGSSLFVDNSHRIHAHVNYLNLQSLGIGRALQRLGFNDMTQISAKNETSADTKSSEFKSDYGETKNSGTLNARSAKAPAENELLVIQGVVYDQGVPLTGASISIENKEFGVVSGVKGEFEIEVNKGDVLLIGYLGMENKAYQVDGDQFLEIYLDTKKNELDEVVLNSRTASDNTITTSYGEQNKDQIGYTIQTVEDDVFEGQNTISDATRGKIISYNYSQNDDLSQIQLRKVQTLAYGTVNPLIVIDNVPLGVNDSSTGGLTLSTSFIDPSNIEKVTVLRGLAATNKYGSLARGGAILITTKTGVGADPIKKGQTNSALVKGNVYNESVTSIQNDAKNNAKEVYLSDFKKVKNIEQALAVYQIQRNSYLYSFEYFLNLSEYMIKWGNPDVSKRILLNILELHPDDPDYLRLVAMKMQDKKDYNIAERAFERLKNDKPKEAQSYRDLALIYQDNHKYQKSLDVYKKIKNNGYPEVNFEGLKKIVNSEMKRLLLLNKSKLNTEGLSSYYYTPLNYKVRVVLDWNNRNAEFDLQFVNPQKKFFVWSHRASENAERLRQEREQGFNSEEFLLIDAESGKWQINIEAHNKTTSEPLALRYTVFKDYGRPGETRQSKTILLNEIEGKYLLGIIKVD